MLAIALLAGGCSSGNDHAQSNEGTNSADRAEQESTGSPSSTENDRSSEPMPHNTNKRLVIKEQIEAGQLTAGEWNDLAQWDDWETMLNNQQAGEYQQAWSYYDFRKMTVSVTGGGRPIADAAVQAVDEQGKVLWRSRTNAGGLAYLYPNLFHTESGQELQGEDYLIEVTAGQQQKRFENVELNSERVLAVEFQDAVPMPDQVDLMFVVDTTGSMKDELDYLEAELKDVVTQIGSRAGGQLDIRVSPNFYRDRHDDYIVKPYPFTKDIDKAVRQIAQQEAQGGGDFPEAVDEALHNAIHDHEWSKEARARLLFLVLDAPPHKEDQVRERMQKLTSDAAAEGIRIIPVVSSGIDEETEYLMRFEAIATGGSYLFLTDHSGIGNDHLEPDVGEYEVKPLNDLLVDVIERYIQP